MSRCFQWRNRCRFLSHDYIGFTFLARSPTMGLIEKSERCSLKAALDELMAMPAATNAMRIGTSETHLTAVQVANNPDGSPSRNRLRGSFAGPLVKSTYVKLTGNARTLSEVPCVKGRSRA